ncbi:MAG: sugar ABC transporter substrate-binding protein [Candidatus Gastranaerophilales bacterium]|nr:sugar ABC transporter substrate-binding protein [Candidatus Gastranaerophilales bacterium]
MIKSFKFASIIFFLIILLTGCTKQSPQDNVREIEFWTLQLSGFSGYINGVIAEYERQNPDVKIKWIDVPFSEGEKRALAAVLSKNVPDLINMNPTFGATLASKGALTDIKQLISQEEYENYPDFAWEASSIDGKVFGVPWYITSAVTFYNTEIIEKAGIQAEELPQTYFELEKIAPAVKRSTGKFVLMPTLTENGWMLKFFNAAGIPIVNEAHDKALFNTPQAEEALAFWQRMYKNGYIPAESITQGHREALEKYLAGETAFIVAGANFLNIIKQNSPQVYAKTNVTKQLTGAFGGSENSAKGIDFSLMNLVIPKKSRYPQEALKFALFLTNAQNQLEFCKLAPILPSEIHALKSDYFTMGNESDLTVKSRLISASQLENVVKPVPALQNSKDLNEIIDAMTQEVMLGYKSPKDALKKAVEEWNNILK